LARLGSARSIPHLELFHQCASIVLVFRINIRIQEHKQNTRKHFKLAGCLFINLASKQKLAFIGNIVNLLLGLFLAVTNPKA
jgi:hypothetical protein